MKKLHFSIFINAPKKKVWETMLNEPTYREWTAIFNPVGSDFDTSYYEGEWKTGSDMRFIGQDKNGVKSGMISRIKKARVHDYVSIQHLGMIEEGKEKIWTEKEIGADGMFENYTLNDKDNGTELLIELDTIEEYAKMFEDLWPKALDKLKELAEK